MGWLLWPYARPRMVLLFTLVTARPPLKADR